MTKGLKNGEVYYSCTMDFDWWVHQGLTEWRKKKERERERRPKQKLRKHFELKAKQPQFSTLILLVQMGFLLFLCENKECVFFSVQREDDYSQKKLSTEMWRHNEQITPLKFSATACKFETNKYICVLTPRERHQVLAATRGLVRRQHVCCCVMPQLQQWM